MRLFYRYMFNKLVFIEDSGRCLLFDDVLKETCVDYIDETGSYYSANDFITENFPVSIAVLKNQLQLISTYINLIEIPSQKSYLAQYNNEVINLIAKAKGEKTIKTKMGYLNLQSFELLCKTKDKAIISETLASIGIYDISALSLLYNKYLQQINSPIGT